MSNLPRSNAPSSRPPANVQLSDKQGKPYINVNIGKIKGNVTVGNQNTIHTYTTTSNSRHSSGNHGGHGHDMDWSDSSDNSVSSDDSDGDRFFEKHGFQNPAKTVAEAFRKNPPESFNIVNNPDVHTVYMDRSHGTYMCDKFGNRIPFTQGGATAQAPPRSTAGKKPGPSPTTNPQHQSQTTNPPHQSQTTNPPHPSQATNPPHPSQTTNPPHPSQTTNTQRQSQTTYTQHQSSNTTSTRQRQPPPATWFTMLEQKADRFEDMIKTVSPQRLNKHIDEAMIRKLTSHLGVGWRRVPRHLGSPDNEIDRVYHECGEVRETVNKLLVAWTQRNESPDVMTLVKACVHADQTRLAQLVLRL